VNDQAPTSLDAEAVDPEDAVRRYLRFIEDPTTARDELLLGELRRRLETTTDKIDQLDLLSAIERAEAVDGESIRAAFVRHARPWATGRGITVSAFRQLGVTDIALAEAGFDLGFGGRGAGTRAGRSKSRVAARSAPRADAPTPAVRRPRAAKVSADEIRSWILGANGPFTLAQVMAGAGGSLGTINKVIDDLLAVGQVRKLGTDPSHRGRGRAPFRYEVATA
jgi:hypothetical protein